MSDQLNPRNIRRTRIVRETAGSDASAKENAEASADNELKNAKTEIAELSKQVTALKKESKESLSAVRKQLQQAENEKSIALQQVTALQEQSDEAEREKKQLSERIALLEQSSSQEIETVRRQLQQAEQEKGAVSQQLTLLKKQADEAEQEKKSLAEKVKLLSSQTEGRVAAVQKREKQLEKENKSLAQQVADLTSKVGEYEKLAEKAAKERQQLAVLEKNLQDVTRKAEKLSANADSSKLKEFKSLQSTVQSLESDKTALSNQVTALLGENRRLAEEVDPMAAELQQIRDVAAKTAEDLRSMHSETTTFSKLRMELERKITSLESEKASMEKQLSLQASQLKQEGKILLIPSDRVAKMVSALSEQIGSNMSGMTVRGGELRLKVAFGSAGDSEGFVVPTVDSDVSIKENLHEVVVRFDRSVSETLE